MPPPLTFLDFAAVCDAVYDITISAVGGFTRFRRHRADRRRAARRAGGIAQIVAGRRGVPAAVAISAPAVTAVPGVSAAWSRTRAPIVCLRVRNDPINHTGQIGAWLGQIIFLDSSRTGGAAHSVAEARTELGPQGPFSTLGARDPFAT